MITMGEACRNKPLSDPLPTEDVWRNVSLNPEQKPKLILTFRFQDLLWAKLVVLDSHTLSRQQMNDWPSEHFTLIVALCCLKCVRDLPQTANPLFTLKSSWSQQLTWDFWLSWCYSKESGGVPWFVAEKIVYHEYFSWAKVYHQLVHILHAF